MATRKYTARRKHRPLASDAPPRPWTPDDLARLRAYYETTPPADFSLNFIASRMGRSHASIALKASRLKLGNYSRPKRSRPKFEQSELPWGRWVKFPHPKGMKGKKHTDAVRAEIARDSRARWVADRESGTGLMAESHRQRRSDQMSQRNVAAIHAGVNPAYSRAKRGRREGLGDYYYRSAWEANFARYLNFLVKHKEIARWEYEVDTFWFEAIRRGVRSYTPDFKVWRADGSFYYIEVKGWMDPKSATKLKRMRIYHPTVTVELVDQKRYRAIKKTCAGMLPGWE